ncbi:response regulator receiver protein [Emticicia oligotrophica DSM 17448]|jgi:CheY-like chemotaxis protein|uniref:Response regulator receiver protein n=1 Tax=Emticicia oligotrophica (strain DSM 17448 / CIP 109782 / MTCC 6937 / GPTSA100-15) TaxID=929562 RepID=A0ABN4ASQ1_EMTOG|nr:response regulator [Emticicia oligotrophica]AFK04396.1 response regulator receiver protein [Emticicia oligotrophica DSM 17448]
MKILVVDDEEDVRTLFEQRFRREIRAGEFDFAFSGSGEDAIAYLQDQDLEAILILSDINMPGMSGIELLRQIRSKSPMAPPTIMMITAYGDSQTLKQAMDLGANDFLTKPLDFIELKQKLKSSI